MECRPDPDPGPDPGTQALRPETHQHIPVVQEDADAHEHRLDGVLPPLVAARNPPRKVVARPGVQRVLAGRQRCLQDIPMMLGEARRTSPWCWEINWTGGVSGSTTFRARMQASLSMPAGMSMTLKKDQHKKSDSPNVWNVEPQIKNQYWDRHALSAHATEIFRKQMLKHAWGRMLYTASN
eukprot:1137893-Pelagomonas_calceolata.AAC.2